VVNLERGYEVHNFRVGPSPLPLPVWRGVYTARR
jgi:hypothetical protein